MKTPEPDIKKQPLAWLSWYRSNRFCLIAQAIAEWEKRTASKWSLEVPEST